MMPVFEFLPYCALACIIEVAVVGLIDFHGFKTAWRVSKPEFTVSVVTFVAVLGLGIELGVLIGAGISLAIVLRRAASPNTATARKGSGQRTQVWFHVLIRSSVRALMFERTFSFQIVSLAHGLSLEIISIERFHFF